MEDWISHSVQPFDFPAESGIEIPYPQQEIHLRDFPWEKVVGEAPTQAGKRVRLAANGDKSLDSDAVAAQKSEESAGAGHA